MQDFDKKYDVYREAVEEYLSGLFLKKCPYDTLQESMRYSVLAGGKRVRPVLTLAFCDALGGDWRCALPFACGLELVHTYSLIHDDLPCMDNDDFRRGKPTCHKAFGETIAVLAGDALQPEAFKLLATAPGMTERQRLDAVAVLAEACGGDGMVAGQVLDIEGKCRNESEIKLLHSLKTGAMICAAAELGCIAAGGDDMARAKAVEYGKHIGLAFQVRDDMLDVIADENEFGKPVGSDRVEGKVTFVDLLGLDECAAVVEKETKQAQKALEHLGDTEFLMTLAQWLADRRK